MKTLSEINKLMAAGETAQADTALKELLAAEPNNLQAKMLYGTCRQLLGDEETFRRIHDELAPVMVNASNSIDAALWKKYDSLFQLVTLQALVSHEETITSSHAMEYIVLAVLIIGALVAGIRLFSEQITNTVLYGGSKYYELERADDSVHTVSDKFSDGGGSR